MNFAFHAWEFAADTHLIKLQPLQNKIRYTIFYFPRCTRVHEMHMVFHLTYAYDYMTKECRQQEEVILNYGDVNVRNIGQGEFQHRNYRLKFRGGFIGTWLLTHA
jgi:hypothetical protein